MAMYTYFSMRVFLITTHSCVGKSKKAQIPAGQNFFLLTLTSLMDVIGFPRQSIRLGNQKVWQFQREKETRYINYMRESERGWNHTHTNIFLLCCCGRWRNRYRDDKMAISFFFLHRIPLFFFVSDILLVFCFIDFKLHGWDGAQTVRNTSCLGGRGWAADDLRCVSFAQFCRQINSLSSSKNRFPFFLFIPAVSFNLPVYLTPFRLNITYRIVRRCCWANFARDDHRERF